MSEKHPAEGDLPADVVDRCRARLLALTDRLQAVEEEARAELREVTAALGEPADYEAFLEHQVPGTPHHELYRCAESFELGASARRTLTNAAAAISRYETGLVLPQLGQLEKLLRALDIGLPELVFAMDHLGRTARLLERAEQLPAEELLHHSVTAYWHHVSDLHLSVAAEVRRVVEDRLGAGGPECEPR